LLPLWARAKESTQKNPLIIDGQAERIVRALDYHFSKMDKSLDRYYQLSQVIRAKMTDDEIRSFINIHPHATIVSIGAGLDTTFERIDNGSIHWYDLDVPDVIELRRQFITETERSGYISKSVFDLSWFEDIGSAALGLLFVACGVFLYFTGKQVKRLFSDLATRFPGSEIVFDTMSKLFLLVGNWAIIKKSGMDRKSFMKWGAKSAKEITRWDSRFTVVDEYPLFSRIHLDESWDKDIINRMKQANRMRGLNIFHLRFEP
jgi:O-methyltransferase involved in polyketide biosynthesis